MEILSERELPVSEMLIPFLQESIENTDIKVHLTWKWEAACHPVSCSIGGDMLLEYYKEGTVWFCESKGGKAPVTCTCYPENFEWMQCAVNAEPFLQPPDSMEKIFRLLPMRAVFTYFRTILFHASQISIGGKGILFAAPSGTGKTTQARLWQKYEGAEIVCNDRTLVRKKKQIWSTYGYPIDGSEPIRSNAVNPLGCIVLLAQGDNNQVIKLRPYQAIKDLIEQTVMDSWNLHARERVMELIIELIEDIPVYRQICTPDRNAVIVLKEKLLTDGVIADGTDSEASLGQSWERKNPSHRSI